MKTTFANAAISLVDHIRAESGDAGAVFENRMAVIYNAAYHIMKSGNKTQFNMVQAAISAHASEKACRAEGQTHANKASKYAFTVYQAYGAAVAQCGVPALMPKATHEQLDDAAAIYATEFASVITLALMPEEKQPVSEEVKAEKAKAKADKEAKAKAAIEQTIKAEAEKLANASVVTLADMVRIVANAVKTGMVDADSLAMLDSALDSVAVSVDYVPVAVDDTEAMPA